MTLVIGITGTIGAGKDAAARFFVEEKKFPHISLSDMLREETAARNLEQTRDNWYAVGQDLRKQEGSNTLAQRAVDRIKQEHYEQVLVTSFRHPDEVVWFTHQKWKFVLIMIDAPAEMRYERVLSRGNTADQISFETFVKQEQKELQGSGTELQMQAVFGQADAVIQNTGSLEALYQQLSVLMEGLSVYA